MFSTGIEKIKIDISKSPHIILVISSIIEKILLLRLINLSNLKTSFIDEFPNIY